MSGKSQNQPSSGRARRKAAGGRAARQPRVRPDFSREAALRARGIWPVAGCDEVGRGPLAGPVVAAAVILDPACIPDGIDDSKRLSQARREALFAAICERAIVAVAMAPPALIDRDNIRRASLDCLARAVRGLCIAPAHVFVDGRDPLDLDCGCEAVIGGDHLVQSIAAASIIAKVTRDRLMRRLAGEFPAYGFERHMGYGVPAHLAALRETGASIHHRRSFAPVAAAKSAGSAATLPSPARASINAPSSP